MEYEHAPKEVRTLVKEIRAKNYSKYKKAQIVILLRLGMWDKWAQIGIVSKKLRAAGILGDYVLTINGGAWERITNKQKCALIDHELYHMARKKTRNGTKFKLRRHDFEEFTEIVKRYGAWTPSLSELKKIFLEREE